MKNHNFATLPMIIALLSATTGFAEPVFLDSGRQLITIKVRCDEQVFDIQTDFQMQKLKQQYSDQAVQTPASPQLISTKKIDGDSHPDVPVMVSMEEEKVPFPESYVPACTKIFNSFFMNNKIVAFYNSENLSQLTPMIVTSIRNVQSNKSTGFVSPFQHPSDATDLQTLKPTKIMRKFDLQTGLKTSEAICNQMSKSSLAREQFAIDFQAVAQMECLPDVPRGQRGYSGLPNNYYNGLGGMNSNQGLYSNPDTESQATNPSTSNIGSH